MLTMVTVENPLGVLSLPLTDASQGYVVKDIQGLDPVKGEFVSSTMAGRDGVGFQSSRRGARNITMTIGLECDYVTNTVAGLRTALYDYMVPRNTVIFSIYVDGDLFAVIDATVESVNNNMFTTDPEVLISMLCWDPDLWAPDMTTLNGNTTSASDTIEIDYPGTTPTGIEFIFTIPADTGGLVLYNTRPDHVVDVFRLAGNFLAGDVVRINTNPGEKAVKITRGGTEYSVLFFLDQTSTWLQLMRGVNQFRAYYTGADSPFSLTYTVKYGGY